MLFTVKGWGAFPLDMLRYDSCWPATAADSERIRSSFRGHLTSSPPQEIRLVSASASPITVDRWASFGWSVTA